MILLSWVGNLLKFELSFLAERKYYLKEDFSSCLNVVASKTLQKFLGLWAYVYLKCWKQRNFALEALNWSSKLVAIGRGRTRELTGLILINELLLTGLPKNRNAAANFGCSWNLNRVYRYHRN